MSEDDQTIMNLDLKDTKAVLQHVLKTITIRCKEEADSNITDGALTGQDRIFHFTGLTCDQIYSLLTENKQHSVQVSTLSISDRISILNGLKCVYDQNILPTYQSIFETVTKSIKIADDKLITDMNYFMEELETMGFVSKETTDNKTVVIEDPEVRFERYMYLLKLKKLANNPQWQDIVYIDERIVNGEQQFKKVTPSDLSKNQFELDNCLFYHAVSVRGFITGIFMDQASEEDFAKWLSDIMLSHLKVPTVIIMDNNSLHGSPNNTDSISRYNTKKDMMHWLAKNNISCSNNMSKPALYELIIKYKDNQCETHIDQIIRSHGHKVLRLPRHFYDLSITTPFWENYVENNIEIETNTSDIQSNLLKTITSVAPSTWAEYEKCIIEYQTQLFDIDTVLETYCDAYEIKT